MLNRMSILPVAIVAILSSCTHPAGDAPVPNEILPSSSQFSENGRTVAPNSWWTAFQDPQLNNLIAKSLENNPGIGQAWARLRMAEASARIASADLYPDLSFTGSAQRRFQNAPGPSNSTDSTSGSTSFTTSYELDLWGRVRAESDAASLESKATEQDLQTAATSLIAQVANTWFTLTEKTSQRQLLGEQYKNAMQTLDLMQTRFENGSSTGTDLLQQQQSVEAANAVLILNQSEIEVLEHTLAILLGTDPSQASYHTETSLPDLPEFPALGIPAVVLNQRPDIQAAWLRIQAADASVAAAIANRFPKITLSGSLTSSFGSPINLFENWVKTLLANLSLPIIDSGARTSQVDLQKAQLTSAILAYQTAFLEAIKEVEDAIVQERQQLLYIESLQTQVELSQQVYEQTLTRFQSGNRSYLQVLTTQDSLHSLNRTLLTARRTLLSYRIDLYRAIGGPIDLPESEIFKHSTQTRL